MRSCQSNKRANLNVEALETRNLMTVTSVVLDAGVLRVMANHTNDNIEIRQTLRLGGNITVSDKTLAANNSWSFSASSVQRIVVELNGGNDRLDSTVSKPTIVMGGDGNDLVITGGGADEIRAGNGHDSVFAGSGADVLHGMEGNDWLAGGFGDDKIHGDGGTNTLLGEVGNDIIYTTSRTDRIDGGDGYDYLQLLAGQTATGGENVKIGMPLDQPQTDGWSCGPNAGSRYLRSYGLDVNYSTLRSQVQQNHALSKFKLGTLPSVLRDAMKNHKAGVSLDTGASRERVLELLGQGKPVVALVAVKKVDIKEDVTGIKIGTYGLLHYVVLTGFDQATQTIRYVDTTGEAKTWTYSEFSKRSSWVDYFTGAGSPLQEGLAALGLRNKTIIF